MKSKQEMMSKSIYMPKSLWVEIDKVAAEKDLSANQVIRRLVSSWLMGFLKEDKDNARAVPRSGRKKHVAREKSKTAQTGREIW